MRGIYKITNQINGKCYIGKSETLPKRLSIHYSSIKGGWHRNKHLQAAWNKYGEENFTVCILEILDENEDINEREKYYISLYKSYDPNYGYNLTMGGDGGNSYVDCMTEEEKEKHYKKHKELRMGEKNCNYGKHLYTDGIEMKYLTEDEITEYEKKGWYKGANESFKKGCRERTKGTNNPFYGKKHSPETVQKIMDTKRKNNVSQKGKIRCYKENVNILISPEQLDQYLKDGWKQGISDEYAERIKNTKNRMFQDPLWKEEHYKNITNQYSYDNKVFYGQKELINYLKENGYSNISKRAINTIITKQQSKTYPELVDKIKLEKKRGE